MKQGRIWCMNAVLGLALSLPAVATTLEQAQAKAKDIVTKVDQPKDAGFAETATKEVTPAVPAGVEGALGSELKASMKKCSPSIQKEFFDSLVLVKGKIASFRYSGIENCMTAAEYAKLSANSSNKDQACEYTDGNPHWQCVAQANLSCDPAECKKNNGN